MPRFCLTRLRAPTAGREPARTRRVRSKAGVRRPAGSRHPSPGAEDPCPRCTSTTRRCCGRPPRRTARAVRCCCSCTATTRTRATCSGSPLPPARAGDRIAARADLSPGYGHAWFPLLAEGREQALEAAAAATDAILAWLDRAAPDAGADRPARLLAGRRDGARAAAPRPRAVRVRGEPRRASRCRANATGDERMSQLAPPVFWGRGTADGVIADGCRRAHAGVAAAHVDARRAHLRGRRALDRPTASSRDVAAFIRGAVRDGA